MTLEEAGLELYESRYDGFVGRCIGKYRTLEGNEGLVLQQVGNKVVHVYQMKHLIHRKRRLRRIIDERPAHYARTDE